MFRITDRAFVQALSTRRVHREGFWFAVLTWVQVGALLRGWLGLFDLDQVGIGIGVLADAGDLPGDLRSGLAARDREPVAGHFLGDVQVGTGRADCRELVAEIPIE